MEPCILCEQPHISFFDIMKHFCGRDKELQSNMCDIHDTPFEEMAKEFFDNNSNKTSMNVNDFTKEKT